MKKNREGEAARPQGRKLLKLMQGTHTQGSASTEEKRGKITHLLWHWLEELRDHFDEITGSFSTQTSLIELIADFGSILQRHCTSLSTTLSQLLNGVVSVEEVQLFRKGDLR